ncbi:hypothetical protein [Rhodococcus pyridinivorans]|uniref:Tail assembly chaperone n=1 Tax=Rhodococcus pyridinivorans TaxID=103816 RepID=A0A7M2XJN2_9NOCA|nr:hypothetical protein [Rhodococcus pyridinivorans]QOV97603.1 hypothetical protein INP59_16905 [Rhodococcus pyridinivorans]
MDDHDADPPASFFETLLSEAVGPYFFELDGTEVVIPVPSADAVCDLDIVASVHEQFAALVDDDDLVDEILEVFADRPVGAFVELVGEIRSHFGVLVPPDGGFLRVVETLDLYGEDIERDLIDLRLDLYDWVREHEDTPWSKLFRILERPPEGGWFEAALKSDIELAEQIAKRKKDSGEQQASPSRPPLVGWTRDRDTNTAILETLRRIEASIFQASPKIKGRGPKTPRNLLRPLTAQERYDKYRLYVEHDDIASKVLGSRYKRLSLPDPTDD